MNAVFRSSLAMAFSLLLLDACASTPKTFSNADPSTDFSQYKTYGFFSSLSTDNGQYESLVSNFLKVAVAQEFDKRGLVHDDGNPLSAFRPELRQIQEQICCTVSFIIIFRCADINRLFHI